MIRALIAIALAGAALAPVAAADDERISRHLERFRTLETMSTFVGRRPVRCFWASQRTELCSWILSKKDPQAWKKLARLLHTRRKIGLICEFEVDGPGTDNWCFARPRESERQRWKVQSSNLRALERLAQATIAVAETLPAVSRLMGIGPDECKPGSQIDQSFCVWRADKNVYGHSLLAASIGTFRPRKVRLECVFPNDGSKRAEGSCVGFVGY